jgi:exportin-2 (importin alpha re-exporter)
MLTRTTCRWRAEFRTDDLFLEIKFVLERFCTPYLSLFLQTDQLLSSPTTTPTERSFLLQTLHLLLQLYHDLNSQDLPEFFEDRLPEFMGLLSKYLQFSLPAVPTIQIQGAEEEDEEETDLEKIQAEICDIATLYALRYLDAFEEGGFVAMFVERVWGLLMKAGRGVRYDSVSEIRESRGSGTDEWEQLVARATTFLSAIVVMPSKRALFEAPATLTAFCENIILPNMGLRTFEEELFEEDGGEFLRRDLDSGGTSILSLAMDCSDEDTRADSETRRQAASDFTRALMEQFENQVTSIITSYIGTYLAQYAADPQTNWKSKDTAIFLLTSIASRGSTVQVCHSLPFKVLCTDDLSSKE